MGTVIWSHTGLVMVGLEKDGGGGGIRRKRRDLVGDFLRDV